MDVHHAKIVEVEPPDGNEPFLDKDVTGTIELLRAQPTFPVPIGAFFDEPPALLFPGGAALHTHAMWAPFFGRQMPIHDLAEQEACDDIAPSKIDIVALAVDGIARLAFPLEKGRRQRGTRVRVHGSPRPSGHAWGSSTRRRDAR